MIVLKSGASGRCPDCKTPGPVQHGTPARRAESCRDAGTSSCGHFGWMQASTRGQEPVPQPTNLVRLGARRRSRRSPVLPCPVGAAGDRDCSRAAGRNGASAWPWTLLLLLVRVGLRAQQHPTLRCPLPAGRSSTVG